MDPSPIIVYYFLFVTIIHVIAIVVIYHIVIHIICIFNYNYYLDMFFALCEFALFQCGAPQSRYTAAPTQ